MAFKLFSRIRSPEKSAIPAPRDSVRWLTWSAEARELLERWTEESVSLAEPALSYFGKGEYAYTLSMDAPVGPRLRRQMVRVANAFHKMAPGNGLTLFDSLIDERITGAALRRAFAFVRLLMVEMTNDPLAAIFAPLGAADDTQQGSFPLHADLYPPVFLFNVFDRVPKDRSGASLFLSMNTALRILNSSPSVPPEIKAQFRRCLAGPSDADRYAEFYDILHGSHPWTAEIAKAMQAQRAKFRFESGQGYLVNDRLWLHGREAPRGGVPRNRLYRLIFDTERTRRLRIEAARRK